MSFPVANAMSGRVATETYMMAPMMDLYSPCQLAQRSRSRRSMDLTSGVLARLVETVVMPNFSAMRWMYDSGG